MKKFKINLQLFAEEAAPEAGASTETENPTEENKPGTEQKPEKGGADEKKYSDADLDRIFNKKFAEMKQKEEKKVAEAAKLAEMNAQQKAEYERDKIQKELDEYKRKDALAEMSKTARKMFSDEGISISDELLSRLVTTDAAETKSAVDSFVSLYKEAVEDGVKARLRGEVPKAGTNKTSTISEIDKRIAKYN